MEGKDGSGAAKPALNFVENKRGLVLIGKRAALTEKFCGALQNSAFAENGLENDGAGVRLDGGAEGLDVVPFDKGDIIEQGLETLAILILPGEGHGTECPAMIGPFERNQTGLGSAARFVSGETRQFNSALNCLGTAVGEENSVEPGQLAKAFGQRPLIFVVVQIRKMNHAGSLLADGLHDPGVRVTERVDTQPGDKVEIPLAFEIEEVNALSAFKGNRIPIVGGKKKTLFEFGNLLKAGHT